MFTKSDPTQLKGGIVIGSETKRPLRITSFSGLLKQSPQAKSYPIKVVLLLIILALPLFSMSQPYPVTVNVTVTPPYTSSISDYMNIPNKIIITLSNTTIGADDIDLYLKVAIRGDNGVSAVSEPDYKPVNPIMLKSGSTYIVNVDNISDAFNLKHIVIEGITLSELITGAGLPEGAYQICVTAYDFNTGQPLSLEEPMGCSTFFMVTNFEPPVFNNIYCGDIYTSLGPQSVVVSWLQPSIAIQNPSYHFELVEIPENVEIDPNEAFLTAKYPVLYEEELSQTMLSLTVDKVSLNPGYTYVMRVTIEDPSGKAHFRNNGTSEVCFFKYEVQNQSLTGNEKYIRLVRPAYNHPDSVLSADPVTGFYSSWRVEPFDTLKYKNPLDEYPNCQFLIEFFDNKKTLSPVLKEYTGETYFHLDPSSDKIPFINGNTYWERLSIINTSTQEIILQGELTAFKYQWGNIAGMQELKVNGKIEYRFEKDDPSTYPVSNAQVKLIAGFLLSDTVNKARIPVPEENIPVDILNAGIFNLSALPLASTTTAINGNFFFTCFIPENIKPGTIKKDFTYSLEGKEYKGDLMLYFKPILDNPYYSGLNEIITFSQENYDLGTLTTYVYGYKLNAIIYEGYKDAPGVKKNLDNKEIYILRKSKKPGLPLYEGTHFLSNVRSFAPVEVSSAGYSVVASGLTKTGKDSQGKDVATVTFTRLIQNLVNNDDYYLWIKGTSIMDIEPFRYYVSMSEGQKGKMVDINGMDFSIGNSIFSRNNSNNASNTYSTSNLSAFSSNNNIFQGVNTNLNSGSNPGLFGQNSFETFEIPEFDFGVDKISEETGVFSDITEYSFTVESAFTLISDQPPMSGISGRIVYEFPAKAGNSRPLNSRKISLISCLVSDEPGEASKLIKSNTNAKYPEAFPGTYTLFTSQTDANGYFNFQFPNILPNLKNIDPTQGEYEVSTGKLNRNQSWTSWESDPGTEFEIVYSKKPVKVKRVLRIVIEDEAGIFLSPCENFIIDPLKSSDVGTINAEVFSYKLKGGLNYEFWNPQDTVGKNKTNYPGNTGYIWQPHLLPIKDVECYVLRSNDQINQYGLPADEGQNIVGTLDEFPNFKIIARYTTGSEGEFEFDNLVFRNTPAPVLLHFRTKDMAGQVRFEPKTHTPKVNSFAKPAYFFRNDYNYSEITGFSTKMIPANPTLKGRVVSNVNMQKGLNEAIAYLTITFDGVPEYKNFIKTDTTGKFDFTPDFEYLANSKLLDKISNVNLRVGKYKFHYLENGVKKARWEQNLDKSFFQMGRQAIFEIIPLNANGNIKGRIVNESNTPVDAYVQFLENPSGATSVGAGEMHKTGSNVNFSTITTIGGTGGSAIANGKFDIPAIPGNHRLVVIPRDVAYFADTIDINVLSNADTDIGDTKVYERSHRIYFFVKAASSGIYSISTPLKGALVSIIGCPNIPAFVSDQNGKVALNFKNVSEANLTLKVSGPAGSNYVPKMVSFVNEESESPVMLPSVVLEPGISLKGKVLLDGKPTPDAEVYVELSKYTQTDVDIKFTAEGEKSEAESQYLFTTRTKTDGTFEITTIPPELKNKKITVKAVYKKANSGFARSGSSSGSSGQSGIQQQGVGLSEAQGHETETGKTVVGESKDVVVPDISGNFTLNMTTFNDMIIKDLWGFPIEITKIEKLTNSKNVAVYGRVKPEGYSPGFDPLEPLSLDVFYVVYQPSDEKINNIPVGIPVDSKVNVNSKRQLKMRYSNAFNVNLKTADGSLLAITRENMNSISGKLNAAVQIIDNSFQYPSSYLDFNGVDFYFCRKTKIQNRTIFSPVIDVFNSKEKGNGSNVVKFNLCNLENTLAGDLKFKFINFNTTADIEKSFIEGQEITLNAVLHAQVKNAGEVNVEVGKIVLKNNAVLPSSGSTPIIVSLIDEGIFDADKAWKLEARNWKVDPKVGGLISNDVTLRTGKIDIPISEFNLRNDFAYIGKADCNNLTMGGYKVDVDPQAETTTGFNQSCGSDSKGHWQLIIHPPKSGKTPAVVKNLPNMNADLQLETVSLLSNGEDVFTIGTGAKPMKLYDIVDFKPILASSLNDGLILGGSLNFHIPRVKSNIGTLLTFTKNAPDSINPKADPIDLDFESKGNISFNTNAIGQRFSKANKTFTTYGTVEEVGKLNPIQVLMTYQSKPQVNDITTTIIESPKAKEQTVNIGDSKTKLINVKCNMNAGQDDWSLFTFEGDMAGFEGVDPESNKHMIFTVHGEIEAEQDKFAAEGMDADFGLMKISYHKGRLLGSLKMENIPMGSAIVSGMANILMDNDGWAFYSNATADGVPAPEATTVNMGILIGNYPSGITADMSSVVLKYSVNKTMPETFNNGLKGFFLVGGRNLPISGLDIGIDVKVAKAYVKVPIAAVDASFYGNFAGGSNEVGMGLNGKLRIEFGLGAITCTDLTGDAEASVFAAGKYKDKELEFSGGADFKTSLSVSQGIPTPFGCEEALSVGYSVNGGFNFILGTDNGFDVKMYLNY
ncbi:MAG: hypothetical protein KA807_02695 [Prolixibacteraceae bacterium]|nr:hypothetical protein [Prolixibacteraceae bacterium]